jgi:hypothetical protein
LRFLPLVPIGLPAGAIKVRQELAELLEAKRAHIGTETRSKSLRIDEMDVNEEYAVQWDVEGETMLIGVTPLHMDEAIAQFTKVEG